MMIAMIPIIAAIPHLNFISVPVSVVPLIPTPTPIIPMIRQAKVRLFATVSNIFFVLSLVATETKKHKTATPEIIQAEVTKARATKSLLQKFVLSVSF